MKTYFMILFVLVVQLNALSQNIYNISWDMIQNRSEVDGRTRAFTYVESGLPYNLLYHLATETYKKISPNTGKNVTMGGVLYKGTINNIQIYGTYFNWYAKRNSFSEYEEFTVWGHLFLDRTNDAYKFEIFETNDAVANSWSEQDVNNLIKTIKIGKELYDYLKK